VAHAKSEMHIVSNLSGIEVSALALEICRCKDMYTDKYYIFTAVTMRNVVFCYIKHQFLFHRRHITSPLQSTAS
jgi:hypothetical protein